MIMANKTPIEHDNVGCFEITRAGMMIENDKRNDNNKHKYGGDGHGNGDDDDYVD